MSEIIKVTVNPVINARFAPDSPDVKFRSVAGVSEKDLIERNTIAEISEDKDEEEQPNV